MSLYHLNLKVHECEPVLVRKDSFPSFLEFDKDVELSKRLKVPQNIIDRTLDITSDKILNSVIEDSELKPFVFKVETIDELKSITGLVDDYFRNNHLEQHHLIPFKYDRQKLKGVQKNMGTFCAAHDAYLYGNSELVFSYKNALNKIYYPVFVSALIGKELRIHKGCSLTINGKNPVCILFDKIVIEKGSLLRWQNGGKLSSKQLIIHEDALIEVISPEGADGCSGQTGIDGFNGLDGFDSIFESNRFIRPPSRGTDGSDGSGGNIGLSGSRGGDGLPVHFNIDEINGRLNLKIRGGNGGNGGKGGDGGKGGQGGNAGHSSVDQPEVHGGRGGHGGAGGEGGQGGDGGKGGSFYLFYRKVNREFYFDDSTAIGGVGGCGGNGGTAGLGGISTHKEKHECGLSGLKGPTGRPGLGGEKGKIIVNGNWINRDQYSSLKLTSNLHNEYKLDVERIKSLGVSSNLCQPCVEIKNAEIDNYLSSNSVKNFWPSEMVFLKDVDQFKEFGGISMNRIQDGKSNKERFIPPSYRKHKNRDTHTYMNHICPAHELFAYANPELVKSYKRVLNKVYYPLGIMVFWTKQLILRSGCSLIIKGTSSVSLICEELIVEDGCKIVFEKGGKLSSERAQIGGRLQIINSAAKAKDGTQGNSGFNGENGKSGENGLPLNLNFQNINGVVDLVSKGGDGGNGGDGGSEIVASNRIITNAGLGGIGGGGGDGGTIYMHFESGNSVFRKSNISARGGQNGKNGDSQFSEAKLESNDCIASGLDGERGLVFINGRELR